MATKQQLNAATLYASLMEEIKVRIAAVDHCTMLKSGLAPPFVKEFCFLQFRMICELVTLGCLVAHGDLKQSKRLQKEWAADKIIEELGRLHPDFFPRSIRRERDRNGHHVVSNVPGRLSKDGLIQLYHDCGGVLHKGSVKKLLKRAMPAQVEYPKITEKAQQLVDLLSEHVVSMLGYKTHFLCILSDAKNDFKVQVAIAEASGPPGPLR